MLPSLGFPEIVLLGVLALVVVGPKDLPLMLRKLGQWTARLRAMAQEFRTGFDELARQAELDELRKEVDALRRDRTLNDIQNEITKPAVLPGTLPRPQPAVPPPIRSAAAAEEAEAPAPDDAPEAAQDPSETPSALGARAP